MSNQDDNSQICRCEKYIDTFIAIITFPFLFPLFILMVIVEQMRKCPHCHKRRGMKCLNFIRATTIKNARGQRTPDHWAYYTCKYCHAKLKYHHGIYSDASENEWELYCENNKIVKTPQNSTHDTQDHDTEIL